MIGLEDEFTSLDERIPSAVAEADFNYIKHIKRDALRFKPEEPTYLDLGKDP